jgi:tRNA threonylcarbamoyladenosine biosynthesis protein TsaB
MRHSAEVFPAMQSLLQQFARKPQEIQQIHISVGPGSFTGLRMAVTIAKIMHLANAAKIVAVDTLDVIASNVNDYIERDKPRAYQPERIEEFAENIAAVLDAKRGQFYIAVYERTTDERRAISNGVWKKILPDSLMTPSQFINNFASGDKPIWLLGDGLLYHRDKFDTKGVRFLEQKYWSPRASKVHLLGWKKALAGQFADAVTLSPKYLLRPDVKIKPR